jgi:hypothetical protein
MQPAAVPRRGKRTAFGFLAVLLVAASLLFIASMNVHINGPRPPKPPAVNTGHGDVSRASPGGPREPHAPHKGHRPKGWGRTHGPKRESDKSEGARLAAAKAGRRVTSVDDMLRSQFFRLREPSTGRWLSRAIDTTASRSGDVEKIFRIQRNKGGRYKDAWTVKGHTRLYLTCELNNHITVDRSWARGFEQWHVTFAPAAAGGGGGGGGAVLRLKSRRNSMFVALREKDPTALMAESADAGAAAGWEVYAVEDCADETSCWGPERRFGDAQKAAKHDGRAHPLLDAASEGNVHKRRAAALQFPIVGPPKPLLATEPQRGAEHPDYDSVTISRRTLRNWASIEGVHPIVYTTDDNTKRLIAALNANHTAGASSCSVPRYRTEADGAYEIQKKFDQPTYRGIFRRAFEMYPAAEGVMFSNSDILYTPSLSETIRRVVSYVAERKAAADAAGKAFSTKWMIVGQRVNCEVPAAWTLRSAAGDDCAGAPAWARDLENFARRGQLFQSNAEDYFIVSRDMFQWADMPDFVVGGVAFDNWVTGKANVMAAAGEATVVDASKTITAVHQNHGLNVKSSHQHPKSDYNLRLAHRNGGVRVGNTADAPIATERRPDGSVTLYEKHRLLFD